MNSNNIELSDTIKKLIEESRLRTEKCTQHGFNFFDWLEIPSPANSMKVIGSHDDVADITGAVKINCTILFSTKQSARLHIGRTDGKKFSNKNFYFQKSSIVYFYKGHFLYRKDDLIKIENK